MLGEIDRYSDEEHKPVLTWLLDITNSQMVWNGLVKCHWINGNRVYKPTDKLIRMSKGMEREEDDSS